MHFTPAPSGARVPRGLPVALTVGPLWLASASTAVAAPTAAAPAAAAAPTTAAAPAAAAATARKDTTVTQAAQTIAAGPYEPTLESLEKYECPEWFRDAKLGIWSHWGPQAVPMAGDWYARHMYVQGHRQYEHHLKNYGHPTQHGYKDIIPLWKAEKWDPERLMALYKRAGARYFVSMGVHHDNFDLWNSKHNRWNAVRMGPRRDVVGDWQKAARAQGLRFGVSEHLGASFTWFQDSHRADKTGPEAGKPYDGADPQYEDLYHWPAAADDRGWYTRDPKWHETWFRRIQDLVDQYQPDLLYTDGPLPFDAVGRSMVAHLYNTNQRRNGGKVEAVYNCKQESRGRWVQDVERGVMDSVRPEPWQTDTSIGDWYYNKDWKYRGADWVIHMLADIVSKNGNLLLNVVQRPDGSLDPEAEQVLEGMAAWLAVNGEAIYGTRPWLMHGEGPVKAKGGHFKEDFAYTARDVRFTTKGDRTLYGIALGWPAEGKLTVRSLAKLPAVTGRVTNVELLGHAGQLQWTHDAEGLAVQLPAKQPTAHAVVLKITTDNVRAFKPELTVPPVPAVAADADGGFTLRADAAELEGNLKTEDRGGQANIGFWDNARDSASWTVHFQQPGQYKVILAAATIHAESPLTVEAAGQKAEGKVISTGAWDKFAEFEMGTVRIEKAGDQTVTIRPRNAASWKAINLRAVRLLRQP